ncbi:hypothetical protein FHU30_008878 [Actinomadura rupiterrae]|nr:hypothetical protein [Actinomadura rupiterrae]
MRDGTGSARRALRSGTMVRTDERATTGRPVARGAMDEQAMSERERGTGR